MRSPGSWISQVAQVLSMPLPAHVCAARERARSVLLAVALAVTVGTLWLPQPVSPPTEGIAVLTATVALTTLASLAPAFQSILNRVGGLLILAQITVLVGLTGGAASVYTPMYALLLLYAAVFYGWARLAGTAALVTATLLLPLVYGAPDASYVTRALVQAVVWSSAAAALHGLVTGIRRTAQTDGLTGLWNHAAFWELAQAEWQRSRRQGTGFSVLMVDLDHFKRVNDTWGHQTGDAVLARVAALLGARCRASDVVARYGGEEFAILLPDTDRQRAGQVARQLREHVLAAALLPAPVTVSIGVAHSEDAGAVSVQALVTAADLALYEAKHAGRNHVVIALPDSAAARG